MHELSICHNLVQQLCNISAQEKNKKLITVYLKIGPLSGVESELISAAFPIASANSPVKDAVLVIQAAPVVIQCQNCGNRNTVSINNLRCPDCDEWRTSLVGGDECLLEKIEFSHEC